MKIKNELEVYEINDEEDNNETIDIMSHWNNHNFVVIRINKTTYTVVGREVIEAVKNSMNI